MTKIYKISKKLKVVKLGKTRKVRKSRKTRKYGKTRKSKNAVMKKRGGQTSKRKTDMDSETITNETPFKKIRMDLGSIDEFPTNAEDLDSDTDTTDYSTQANTGYETYDKMNTETDEMSTETDDMDIEKGGRKKGKKN